MGFIDEHWPALIAIVFVLSLGLQLNRIEKMLTGVHERLSDIERKLGL